MQSGSTRKYLLYAIGEITLVVIGILIALQVNNWNENKKNEATIQRIFAEMQNDLLNDIQEANKAMEFYHVRDSVAAGILNNQYTADDYKDPEKRAILLWTGTNYYLFTVSNSSFIALNDNKEIIPERYFKAVKRMNMLYNERKAHLDKNQTKLDNYVNEFLDFLQDNYDWMEQLHRGATSTEAIDYFMNDPIYKNKIRRYKNLAFTVDNNLSFYIQQSLVLYLYLNNLSQTLKPLPKLIQEVFSPFDLAFIEDYLGRYEFSSFRGTDISGRFTEIFVNDNLLFWAPLDDARTEFYYEGNLLSYSSKDTLTFPFLNDYTLEFNRDNNGMVTGFSEKINGKTFAKFKKVGTVDQ